MCFKLLSIKFQYNRFSPGEITFDTREATASLQHSRAMAANTHIHIWWLCTSVLFVLTCLYVNYCAFSSSVWGVYQGHHPVVLSARVCLRAATGNERKPPMRTKVCHHPHITVIKDLISVEKWYLTDGNHINAQTNVENLTLECPIKHQIK